jgi:hypothetical protein
MAGVVLGRIFLLGRRLAEILALTGHLRRRCSHERRGEIPGLESFILVYELRERRHPLSL